MFLEIKSYLIRLSILINFNVYKFIENVTKNCDNTKKIHTLLQMPSQISPEFLQLLTNSLVTVFILILISLSARYLLTP